MRGIAESRHSHQLLRQAVYGRPKIPWQTGQRSERGLDDRLAVVQAHEFVESVERNELGSLIGGHAPDYSVSGGGCYKSRRLNWRTARAIMTAA